MKRDRFQWLLEYDRVPKSLSELRRWLLASRNSKDIDTFLNPPHPLTLTNRSLGISSRSIKTFINKVLEAKKHHSKVVIAGDYDADGLCATAIMWIALKNIGILAEPFIPNRHHHGYGLNQRSCKTILSEFQPDLIITVDNGIVAHQAIKLLKSKGIEVLVSDHHEALATLPPASAVVHTTDLSGAGVAWVIARELLQAVKHSKSEIQASKLLDLATIATIADQVPLLEANRSIVWHGLQQLQKTTRPGLLALFTLAGVNQQQIDEISIGFRIAPRLNALGRLEHGLDALRLLVGESPHFAQKRAELLEQANSSRQSLTQSAYQQAIEHAKKQQTEAIICIADTEFHEGIIGLVAGRLVEEFQKPSIVISVGETVSKGSVRSVGKVHITDFLRQLSQMFLELGGHAQAAGFVVETKKVPALIRKIQQSAKKQLSIIQNPPALSVLCALTVELITEDTYEVISTLAPFGQSNPRPDFLLDGWKIVSVKTIGKDRQHLKLVVTKDTNSRYKAQAIEVLWWKHGKDVEHLQSGEIISIVGQLEQTVWNNTKSLQFVAKDLGFKKFSEQVVFSDTF